MAGITNTSTHQQTVTPTSNVNGTKVNPRSHVEGHDDAMSSSVGWVPHDHPRDILAQVTRHFNRSHKSLPETRSNFSVVPHLPTGPCTWSHLWCQLWSTSEQFYANSSTSEKFGKSRRPSGSPSFTPPRAPPQSQTQNRDCSGDKYVYWVPLTNLEKVGPKTQKFVATRPTMTPETK